MEIILYPGCSDEQLKFFENFSCSENIICKKSSDYFGKYLLLKADYDFIPTLGENICVFILEFYLKEAVLSKIYDEYSCLDVKDGCRALLKLSEELTQSNVCEKIKNVLHKTSSLNVENFVIFNLRFLMLTVYAITDRLCEDIVREKERKAFASMLRTFSSMYSGGCLRADVEFDSEISCNVSLDGTKPVKIDNDSLLSFLTEKAPVSVRITGRHHCPVVADILNEIFNGV